MDRGTGSDQLTKRIRIWGIVQGVGFRPFVAKLADELDIKGQVRNLGGLVEVIVTDRIDRIDLFVSEIQSKKPLPAEIVHIKAEVSAFQRFQGFQILDSQNAEDTNLETAMIPADLAICQDCLREMQDSENPRFLHPFISCMACGPRYSIIDRIPYDRDNTAMTDFAMCHFCQEEYEDRQNRRYHAQTISCHDCGPYNKLFLLMSDNAREADKSNLEGGHGADHLQIMHQASNVINSGGILAVKGIGGYNFVCSPFIEKAVKVLRRIKKREEKPFAILFQDIDQIKDYCSVDQNEEKLLSSSARPILLLEKRAGGNEQNRFNILPEVTKTSRFIGAFLPGTGLHHQLTAACGPLIATSANFSEEPMIKDDKEMFLRIEGLDGQIGMIDNPKMQLGMLYNNREVRTRLDDSVVRVIDGQPQMIRRAKGYAPVPLIIGQEGADNNDRILAVGGQLKSAFCLTKDNFAYVSQFFGDLDQQRSCEIYDEGIERLKTLFDIKPSLIVCDLHPHYYTTKFANDYSLKFSEEIVQGVLSVQHHHAHVASVMAEHDLLGKVIGVSFDGTGYGTDGAIWGGEFLVCKGDEFNREAHLDYVTMIGGDSSMKEGWKSAMCYAQAFGMDWPETDERVSLIQAGIGHGINTIRSSSMGRLFDAVASYLDIHHLNRYEGECAIVLENFAAEALETKLSPYPMAFDIDSLNQASISARSIFEAIQTGISAGESREAMALGFHYAVSEMILQVCKSIRDKDEINQVALTGGVFQNKIIMEKSLALLRQENFNVYYNISVSPNDGGICLGQAYIGMQHLARRRRESCV